MKKILVIGLSTLIVFFMVGGAVFAEEESPEILAGGASAPIVTYQTHIENIGWEVEDAGQEWKQDGEMSGTSGKGLRLEGIKINIKNNESLGIQYQTHIQNIGWEDDSGSGWKENGDMSGTKGLGYRLEATQMRLTGEDADNYDLYYQVHAQNMGWLGWAKNGESAGTAGYGYRLEGIRVVVVKKGEIPAIGSVDKPEAFSENPFSPYAEVLQQYQIAKENGFSKEIVESMPYITQKFISFPPRDQLYYTLVEISDDAIPELLIGQPSTNGDNIYDMYRLVDGTPQHMFSSFKMDGDLIRYAVLEDNTVRETLRSGAAWHLYNYYKPDGNELLLNMAILCDSSKNFYSVTDKNTSTKEVTKNEAYKIINGHKLRVDFEWISF